MAGSFSSLSGLVNIWEILMESLTMGCVGARNGTGSDQDGVTGGTVTTDAGEQLGVMGGVRVCLLQFLFGEVVNILQEPCVC